MRAENNLSFSETCKILSISKATGRNWIRLGKLLPNEDGLSFDKSYIQNLILELQSDANSSLKKRRNKKQVKGNVTYDKYVDNKKAMAIIKQIAKTDRTFSEKQIRLIITNYAIQLILQKSGKVDFENNLILDFCNKNLEIGMYTTLISDLLCNEDISESEVTQIAEVLNHRIVYQPNHDILGALYLSLRDMADRKTSGSYYTPYETVETAIYLLSAQTQIDKKSILDPCCGTGNFLISLREKVSDPRYIHGWDIDGLCVKICRINIALNFEISETTFLFENFKCIDSLKYEPEEKFDIIIGNPPWGFDFTDYDTSAIHDKYETIKKRGFESFDLFTEKAIMDLAENGYLAFVLPESILNVKSHETIRKVIFETCSFKFTSYIGNVFSGVHCPSVILGIKHDKRGEIDGCKVNNRGKEFTIKGNRDSSLDVTHLNISDEHWHCLNSIEKLQKIYLKGNAKFALGLVTGDNKKLIAKTQQEGFERILVGSDIKKYRIISSNNFIKFEPEKFQQVAPTELYRAPEKLVYRFICDTTVFAYDDKQTLTLNSCNILIPQIPDAKMKYIMAILNSRVAGYYVRMKYNSVKLLKSHIESIPIPMADAKLQDEIIKYVDQMVNVDSSIAHAYDELDELIMDLYELSKDERILINKAAKEKNEFYL